MARTARIVVENVVHHVVARGVNKTRIFRNGFDKARYLKRVIKIAEEEQISIHGYCLLPNHVHFLLTPAKATSLSRFFSRLHTWWAMSFNRNNERSGHLFQARYYSSPLSECHFWSALRYVELNPTRAKLVNHPEAWPWSSARQHLGLSTELAVPLLAVATRNKISQSEWSQILATDDPVMNQVFRKAHRGSRPCGPPEFITKLLNRPLCVSKSFVPAILAAT